MNISAISAYENVSDIKECSESVLYQAINNVLSVTTVTGNKIFCPLCVNKFQLKFELLDHLKNIHYQFLRRITDKSFMYEQCPFCYANFFGKHTVAKHALQTHSKLITQLYLQTEVDSGSELSKCYFCIEFYRKKSDLEFVSHIEKKHFLQFTDLFDEQFMRGTESILSPKIENDADLTKWDDLNLPAGSKTEKDRFDLSSLEKHLCRVQCANFDLKSILKSNRTKVDVHSPSRNARVCRVLQFDLPDENKENSVLTHNIQSQKLLTLSEYSLLCDSKTKKVFKDVTSCSSTADIQPLHCSTPKTTSTTNNIKSPNKKEKSVKRKIKVMKKATFKSYFLKKDLVFQCGKCKKPFQENIELHSHIKQNHKLFILNLLHPCYQCAICEAKFFRNYYLKKHIILHTGHRESLPK